MVIDDALSAPCCNCNCKPLFPPCCCQPRHVGSHSESTSHPNRPRDPLQVVLAERLAPSISMVMLRQSGPPCSVFRTVAQSSGQSLNVSKREPVLEDGPDCGVPQAPGGDDPCARMCILCMSEETRPRSRGR